MGGLSSIFGGGGVKAARGLQGNSFYLPYNLNLPGANIGYTNPGPISNKDWKKIRSGRMAMPTAGVTAGLTPEQEALRSGFTGATVNSLLQSRMGVPGYAGITPELMNEYGLANYQTNNLYAPEVPDTAMAGFLGASGDFLNRAREMAPFDIEGETARQLDLMRSYDAPYEQRAMMANWDNQFGKGILDSTGGQYQTQAMADSFHQKDLQRQMQAYQQALAGGEFQLGQQGLFANLGQQFGMGAGELGNMTFGQRYALNQLGGERAQERFARALGLFGTGQQAQGQNVQNALGYLSGQGSIDSFLANLIGAGGNLGSQRSAANNAAYQPMVDARMGQDAAIAGFTSQFLQGLGQGMQGSFGGGGGGGGGGFDWAAMLQGMGGAN